MSKTLYMLIGPKGAGKTYIGQAISNRTDIAFVSAERIWLELNPNENGWDRVAKEIDRTFAENDRVMVESLGIGDDFEQYIDRLQRRYNVKLIRIIADLEECFRRVKSRKLNEHLAVPDDQLRSYNERAAKTGLNWFIEIDNNGPLSERELDDLCAAL